MGQSGSNSQFEAPAIAEVATRRQVKSETIANIQNKNFPNKKVLNKSTSSSVRFRRKVFL
jgi:hypothetical protein